MLSLKFEGISGGHTSTFQRRGSSREWERISSRIGSVIGSLDAILTVFLYHQFSASGWGGKRGRCESLRTNVRIRRLFFLSVENNHSDPDLFILL